MYIGGRVHWAGEHWRMSDAGKNIEACAFKESHRLRRAWYPLRDEAVAGGISQSSTAGFALEEHCRSLVCISETRVCAEQVSACTTTAYHRQICEQVALP